VRNTIPVHEASTQLKQGSEVRPRETPSPANSGVPSDIDDLAFMRLPDVKAVTGLSKTSIYELIREKSFPAPVCLGPRAVAWVKAEIRQWAIERVQASRSAA
jgi:prophage regulatory protein